MRSPSLELDFRRPPRSPWRWLGWALLAASLAGAVVFGDRYAALKQQHAAAQSQAERLDQRLRTTRVRPATAAATDPQLLASLKRANAVIDQLTVPWEALFDTFEAANTKGLDLLSLTPNVRDRTVRIEGQANSMSELLSFVDRLATQPSLSQVHLLGYKAVQRDAGQPLSFTLAATWRLSP